MNGDPWLLTLFMFSAPAAFSTLLEVMKGNPPDKHAARKTYAVFAIYCLGFGAALAVITRGSKPLMAALPILGAQVLAHEYAFAVDNVEGERRNAETESR